MANDDERGVSRRDFVASAVAIGGSSALAACLDREEPITDTPTDEDGARFPTGGRLDRLPTGQHVWNEYMAHNPHGNTKQPQHQLILLLSYDGSVPPTKDERDQVQSALQTLERAYQWGTGGDLGARLNQGLLFMFGYTPSYFDALDVTIDGLDPAADVLSAVGEDPSKADDHVDAIFILNSDLGSLLLEARQALFGERETVNGRAMPATLSNVFSVAGERSGVVGRGRPAANLPSDEIPEEAPLSMGFLSGFADNQAPEERVTLQSGPFAGGTTLQTSRLHIDVDRWYDQSFDERIAEMFTPEHDEEMVGENGDSLGTSSGVTQDMVDAIPDHASERNRIGHSQKVAKARDEDFVPRILRRTEAVATDVSEGAGFNFNSVQRDVQAFVDARAAMSVDEYDVDVPAENHGIVDFLETEARLTALVPPRSKRALPDPS